MNTIFKIRNCKIHYIAPNTLSGLDQLDYFGIEGGTIDEIAVGAFSGLTVEKQTSAAHQVGGFRR